ncbi:MAG TPA: cell wall-binding repeat-containing protein, partial [Nitriliruptorales bacterium]
VYVTLGGYSRRWLGPGTAHDVNQEVGEGHVFKSVDAGENFVDVSGDLPDVSANWIETRARQMIVGTDLGAFASASDGSPMWAPLEGVPNTIISTIERKPHDPDTVVIATFGRGVWTYEFDDEIPVVAYTRHAGATRVNTAAQVSQSSFPQGTARSAVIARADDYADALAGVPLAWWEDGPILLTGRDRLDAVTGTEIERLGVDTVYVLGGEAALSAQVVADIAAAGVADVVRIGGADRFATSAMIAGRLPATDHAYVVEGRNSDPNRGWPDALAVGPLAAYNGNPVLLVTRDALPPATSAAFGDLDITEATIVGGPAAVAAAVEDAIAAEDVTVRRIAGEDRYDTSARLATVAQAAGLTDHRVWVATGRNWPDALAAGPTITANGGVLLLVDGEGLADVTIDYLREHSEDVEVVTILGGDAAVTQNAEVQIRGAIAAGPVPPPQPTPIQGEVLAEYGFEGSLDGWTAETTDPTGVTAWEPVPPGDGGSTTSAGIPVYNNESSAVMTSPAIEHAGGSVRLSFARRMNTEEGFDFVNVTWSSDGAVFHGIQGWSGMNPAYPLFDQEQFEFVAPAGQVFIRFSLSTDQLVNQEGAFIDNVKVER